MGRGENEGEGEGRLKYRGNVGLKLCSAGWVRVSCCVIVCVVGLGAVAVCGVEWSCVASGPLRRVLLELIRCRGPA